MNNKKRNDGRALNELRNIEIIPGFLKNCSGSAVISFGNTRVLCAASVSTDLPPWMRSENASGGWVTAEYQMLPASTVPRGRRPTKGPNGRSQEIQRLIGRSLRAAVDLEKLGPRMVNIDCDVLDADGGTRCASICGAMVALQLALAPLIASGELEENPVVNKIAAVSVGKVEEDIVLDLCYEEDSRAEVDMNVVMTENGEFIELQGTAEGNPFLKSELSDMLDMAEKGIREIIQIQNKVIAEAGA